MSDVKPLEVYGSMRRATVKLIERMKDGKPGDELTDAELEEACEYPTGVDCKGYSYLQTAIRYCLREFGVPWRRVVGEDRIRCPLHTERTPMSVGERKRINRRAKRNMLLLGSVDRATLSTDQQHEHLVETAVSGTLAQASSSKTVKRLTKDVTQPVALDMGRLLMAFNQNGNTA